MLEIEEKWMDKFRDKRRGKRREKKRRRKGEKRKNRDEAGRSGDVSIFGRCFVRIGGGGAERCRGDIYVNIYILYFQFQWKKKKKYKNHTKQRWGEIEKKKEHNSVTESTQKRRQTGGGGPKARDRRRKKRKNRFPHGLLLFDSNKGDSSGHKYRRCDRYSFCLHLHLLIAEHTILQRNTDNPLQSRQSTTPNPTGRTIATRKKTEWISTTIQGTEKPNTVRGRSVGFAVESQPQFPRSFPKFVEFWHFEILGSGTHPKFSRADE